MQGVPTSAAHADRQGVGGGGRGAGRGTGRGMGSRRMSGRALVATVLSECGRDGRRGSRISARGGRQGIDDLIWDGHKRFLTYIHKHRFATFQDVYYHVMLEWC